MEPALNDLTPVNGTSGRTAGPDGVDPLIREAAAHGPATQLCRTAFNAILKGELPAVSELAKSTGVSSQEVELLIGRALIINESGRVVAAHGLSAVPARQHRLTLRGRPFWTWCAIDALGIPAGLGEDAVAETTCQLCGTPVRVEFKAGEVVAASHPEARVWDAQRLEGRGTAGPPHCALMNLFCSAEHLADWRAAHPGEQGQARNLDEVGELGRGEWGDSHKGCNCQEGAQDECSQ
jgi:hypothetical protein